MSTTRWLDRPLMGTLCRRWVSTQATVLVRTSVARRRSSWSLSCAPGLPYSKMPLLSTWQRSDDDGHIRTTISSSVSVNTCMYAAKTPCTVCSVVKVGLKRWGNYFPSPSSFPFFPLLALFLLPFPSLLPFPAPPGLLLTIRPLKWS